MNAAQIFFGAAAREQIAQGLNTLANAVKVTLGPCGHTVLLGNPHGVPTITKDGISVAREIELANRSANIGAQMVKEVASKTSEVAGDGTTTAVVLAQALYASGVKLVEAGVDPMEIQRGIEAAVEAAVAELQKLSTPVRGKSEIVQVGTISANGDVTIGNLIAEAMERVGKEGVVTIEEAQSTDTTLDVVEGMQFDRGYLSPYFVTDAERMAVVFRDAYVLIHEKKLSSMKALVPLLELVSETGKPLLILAEDVDSQALATLVINKLRGTLSICAVKAPGFGAQSRQMLEDVAVLAGGQVVTEGLGLKLEHVGLSVLGQAKTITIDKDSTTIVGGAGIKDDIQARVRHLRQQLAQTSSDHDREALQGRLAKLAGGVAVLKVGATTESEMKEKKARVEDALHATRAAVEEGVVPGGGVALLRTLPALSKLVLGGEQQFGVNITCRAMEEPLRQISQNAGVEGAVVVRKVMEGKGAYGYNALSGKFEDLVGAGIIDPVKVVRVALQNAASVVALMLTTEALLATRTERPGVRLNKQQFGGSQ